MTARSSARALFSARRAQRARGRRRRRLARGRPGLEPGDLAAAGLERGQIVGVFLRERRQALDRRGVFAAHRPQREQPLLAALELVRIEFAGLDRLLDRAGRALERLDRLVQSLDAGLDQSRRLRHPALQPARDGEQHRQDRRVAGQMVARLADVGGDLFALHHRLPARRERLLLARLDGEA